VIFGGLRGIGPSHEDPVHVDDVRDLLDGDAVLGGCHHVVANLDEPFLGRVNRSNDEPLVLVLSVTAELGAVVWSPGRVTEYRVGVCLLGGFLACYEPLGSCQVALTTHQLER
jgi:hypothetical protein